jgi:hypothetical protein
MSRTCQVESLPIEALFPPGTSTALPSPKPSILPGGDVTAEEAHT